MAVSKAFIDDFNAMITACRVACNSHMKGGTVEASLMKYDSGFKKTSTSKNHQNFVNAAFEKCSNHLYSQDIEEVIVGLEDSNIIIEPNSTAGAKIHISKILSACDRAFDTVQRNRVACRFLMTIRHCVSAAEAEELIEPHVKKLREVVAYDNETAPSGSKASIAPMLDFAKQITQSMGIDMPDGDQFNEESAQNALSQMLANPEITNMMKETFGSLDPSNPGDIGQMFQNLAGKMQDLPDKLKELDEDEEGGSS